MGLPLLDAVYIDDFVRGVTIRQATPLASFTPQRPTEAVRV